MTAAESSSAINAGMERSPEWKEEALVFLDVDGVLNSNSHTSCAEGNAGEEQEIDSNMVHCLRQLLDGIEELAHGNVWLVLSSTWRCDEQLNAKLLTHLERGGIPRSRFHPTLPATPRLDNTGNVIFLCNAVASLYIYIPKFSVERHF